MKHLVALTAILSAAPALAHPGHLAEQGGHTHLLALGAFAAAAGVAAFAVARGVKQRRKAAANG